MMGRLKSEQGQLFYQFIPRDMQPGPATAVRFAGSGDGVRTGAGIDSCTAFQIGRWHRPAGPPAGAHFGCHVTAVLAFYLANRSRW
jgi:hypothetical protein